MNKIQKVGYTLNPFIVEVAETLFDRGYKVGKFVPIVEHPLPNKPIDIATNEDARQDYRRRAAEAMNKNAASFKESCRTRMTLDMVSRFKSKDAFYIPWSFDYEDGSTLSLHSLLHKIRTSVRVLSSSISKHS